MIESNFEILKFHKLSPAETSTRLAYLEHTIQQLHEYHKRKIAKRNKIQSLITLYESLADTLQAKLEQKGAI